MLVCRWRMAEGFVGEYQIGEQLTLDHHLMFSVGILFFFLFFFVTPSYGAVSLSGMMGMSLGDSVTTSVEGNKMTFTQTSQAAVVEYKTLNLRKHEHLKHQYIVNNKLVTDKRYVILHRVTGGESSTLDGKISAIGKGEVWFSNPSGIVFGENAQVVNISGVLATTGEINADYFKRNIEKNSSLEWNVRSNEPITIEKGAQIEVNDNGCALFAGQKINNHGAIIGRFSKIELGSGSAFVLDIDEDSTIGFQIKKGSANSKLVHDGEIRSPGGTIHLGSKTTKGTVGEVMRIDGLIQADTIGEQIGEIEIILQGSTSAKMNLNGTIQAVGKEGGERGGKIENSGGSVDKGKNFVMNVSGQDGGGTISIGKGTETSFVNAEKGVRLHANGFIVDENGTKKGNGNGGKIFIDGDERINWYGGIEVSGGEGGYAGHVNLKTENGILSYDGEITIDGGVDPKNSQNSGNVTMEGKDINFFGSIVGQGGMRKEEIATVHFKASKKINITGGGFDLVSEGEIQAGKIVFDAPVIGIRSLNKSHSKFEFTPPSGGNRRKIYASRSYLESQLQELGEAPEKYFQWVETGRMNMDFFGYPIQFFRDGLPWLVTAFTLFYSIYERGNLRRVIRGLNLENERLRRVIRDFNRANQRFRGQGMPLRNLRNSFIDLLFKWLLN